MKKVHIILLIAASILLAGQAEAQKAKSGSNSVVKKSSKSPKKNKNNDMDRPPEIEELVEVEFDKEGYENQARLDTLAAPADSLTWEIKKLLETSGALNLSAQFAKSMADQKLLDPQQKLPDEFFSRMINVFQEGRGRRLFENMIVNIYRRHYTIEEVRAINAFYNTPVGKKLIANLPVLFQECQMQGAQLGQLFGREIYEELAREGKVK